MPPSCNAQDHQNSAPTVALNNKGKTEAASYYVHFGFDVQEKGLSTGPSVI